MPAPRIIKRLLAEPVVLVELFIVSNLAFLAADIFVAHSMNDFAHWAEWIPFAFSLLSPDLLVLAMWLGGGVHPPLWLEQAPPSTSQRLSWALGMFIGAASICVGVAGLLFHLDSQFFHQQTLKSLVYTAPFVAPLAYAGLGLVIMLNRMVKSDTDEWARWVVLLALGGWIGNFVLSLADHAQNAFFNPVEWVPVVASALAIGALLMSAIDFRNRLLLRLTIGLMMLEIVTALGGWVFHLISVARSPMDSLWDRMIFSAPLFAPLLFADLAILALLGLMTLNLRSTAKVGNLAVT